MYLITITVRHSLTHVESVNIGMQTQRVEWCLLFDRAWGGVGSCQAEQRVSDDKKNTVRRSTGHYGEGSYRTAASKCSHCQQGQEGRCPIAWLSRYDPHSYQTVTQRSRPDALNLIFSLLHILVPGIVSMYYQAQSQHHCVRSMRRCVKRHTKVCSGDKHFPKSIP